jgi:hypothetical protein
VVLEKHLYLIRHLDDVIDGIITSEGFVPFVLKNSVR